MSQDVLISKKKNPLMEALMKMFKFLFKGSSSENSNPEGGNPNAPEEYQGKYEKRILSEKDKEFLDSINNEIDLKIKKAIESDSFMEQYQWESLKVALDSTFNDDGTTNENIDIDKFAKSKNDEINKYISDKYGSEDSQSEIACSYIQDNKIEDVVNSSITKEFNQILIKHAPEKRSDYNEVTYDGNEADLRLGISQLALAIDTISRDQFINNSPEWINKEIEEDRKKHLENIGSQLSKTYIQDQVVDSNGGTRRKISPQKIYEDNLSM